MKIRSGRTAERRSRWTHRPTSSGGVSSGRYRGTRPWLPRRQLAPPSSVSHTPAAEMPIARRVGARAGGGGGGGRGGGGGGGGGPAPPPPPLPLRPRGLLPEPAVELEGR